MKWLEKKEFLERNLEEFINSEIKPFLPDWYKKDEIPQELFLKLAERNWLGFIQKDNRWVESPMLDIIIFYEKIASISPGTTVAVLAHACLGLYALHHWGNEEQRERYFIPGVKGSTLLAFANTEPGAGSDAINIKLEAKKVPGGYLLNGTKMFITNGILADVLLVSAVTNPKAEKRSKSISLFIVEGNPPGLKRQKIHKLVWHPADLGTLFFENCFVPEENLVGPINGGFKLIMQTFTSSRIAIAALAVGTAWGAYKLALDRARVRRVFGKRIIEHQAKAYEFSTMLSRIEAARLLVQKAAWIKDKGQDYLMESSIAKLFSIEEAKEVTSWAADIFGASGIMEENPISKFPLDAWAVALGEGTNDIQKLIIWRQLQKRF